MNLCTRKFSWPDSWPSPEVLLEAAREGQKRAYVPYSSFPVGAALLVEDMDGLVVGCNVENASYGLSICAERSAAVAMVSLGGKKPLAAAIVGRRGEPCLPCGACRQFLAEFNPEMALVFEQGESYETATLAGLFPAPFLLAKKNGEQ